MINSLVWANKCTGHWAKNPERHRQRRYQRSKNAENTGKHYNIILLFPYNNILEGNDSAKADTHPKNNTESTKERNTDVFLSSCR